MISQHLAVLELPPNSTLDEVKRAYRRMSKMYHPDVNPSKDAHERFLEVRAAYEYLLKYGTSLEAAFTEYFSYQQDERERWRREYRARRAAKERAEYAARIHLIRTILKSFDYVAWLIAVFNLVLILDMLIPDKPHNQKIVKTYRSFEKARYSNIYTSDIFILSDYQLRLDRGSIKPLENQQEVVLYASRILDVPNKMTVMKDGQEVIYTQVFSLFKCYKYMIPAMLIFLVFYFRITENPETRLSQAVFLMIFGIAQPLLLVFYY